MLLLGRAHGRKVKQLGYFPLSDLELGSVRPLGQGICSQPATAPTFPDSIFLWLRAADRPCVVLVALKDVFRAHCACGPSTPAPTKMTLYKDSWARNGLLAAPAP